MDDSSGVIHQFQVVPQAEQNAALENRDRLIFSSRKIDPSLKIDLSRLFPLDCFLWLRENKSISLLVPGALSLTLFAWLLSLHPTAAGRVYAAYGGVYVFMAILWLWAVDGIRPTGWDILGSTVALLGMAIIMFAPRSS